MEEIQTNFEFQYPLGTVEQRKLYYPITGVEMEGNKVTKIMHNKEYYNDFTIQDAYDYGLNKKEDVMYHGWNVKISGSSRYVGLRLWRLPRLVKKQIEKLLHRQNITFYKEAK